MGHIWMDAFSSCPIVTDCIDFTEVVLLFFFGKKFQESLSRILTNDGVRVLEMETSTIVIQVQPFPNLFLDTSNCTSNTVNCHLLYQT